MSIVAFKDVSRVYRMDGIEQLAVDGISFDIEAGEFVVILGPSGAGKTTILNLLGGMDAATGGEIVVDGLTVTGLSDDALSRYRAEHIGFVFQFYNLIPSLTAYENVALAKNLVKAAEDAEAVLASVDMRAHMHKFPAQLSGGEQQRVSIARAIAKNPTLLLCDEPTGALDSQTGTLILALLHGLCRRRGKTVIIVTHNAALAEAADRVIRVHNGRIREILTQADPIPVSEVVW